MAGRAQSAEAGVHGGGSRSLADLLARLRGASLQLFDRVNGATPVNDIAQGDLANIRRLAEA